MSTTPIYPSDHFNNGEGFLALLGSFWTQHLNGQGELRAYARGSAAEDAQRYVNYLEAVASTSRGDCPIFHTDLWYALVVRESELFTGDVNLIKHDGAALYGDTDFYGVPRTSRLYALTLPDQSKQIGSILDRPVSPNLCWTNGVEYFTESGVLYMRQNPFENPLFPITNVMGVDGVLDDRELVLWCFRTLQDWEHLYEHFGYVLRLRRDSSEAFHSLVNAGWDAFTGGMGIRELETLLGAAAGLPVVSGASETVEYIYDQPDALVIATDQKGYRYPSGSTANVSVGDIVRAGQVLVDTLQLFDLSDSSGIDTALAEASHLDPTIPAIPALTMTEDFLAGVTSGVSFPNDDVDLEYLGVEDGRAIVTFRVDGHASDVAAFWENVKDRGNLAELLDVRDEPDGIPAAAHLPSTVNPLRILLENLLGHNLIIARLRVNYFGEDAPGLGSLPLLRRVLPPQTTLVVIIEITADGEYYALTDGTEEVLTHDGTALAETNNLETGPDLIYSERVRIYSAMSGCT